MAAFSAKMLGTLVRYYFTYVAYVSAGDAEEYDAYGKLPGPVLPQLQLQPAATGPIPGTGFLEKRHRRPLLDRRLVEARRVRVFAWLGFIGLLLCWRAFKRAVPSGDTPPVRAPRPVPAVAALLVLRARQGRVGCHGPRDLRRTASPAHDPENRSSGLLILAAGLAAVVMIRPHVGLTVGARVSCSPRSCTSRQDVATQPDRPRASPSASCS